jgi:hypothetical protein
MLALYNIASERKCSTEQKLFASVTPPRHVEIHSRNEYLLQQYTELKKNRIRGTPKSKALHPDSSVVAINLKPFTDGILCPVCACVNCYLII